MSSRFDVAVVGAGIAGLVAARQAVRLGLTTVCIEEQMFGGQVLNISELNPAPPGHQGSGADLAAALMGEIAEAGVVTIPEPVGTIRSGPTLSIATPTQELSAKIVILASGARLKALGVPGEQEFEHRGVAHCADCDGSFYTGQDVVVVGGGDSALQEALVLSRHCRKVFIVHRRDRFRARAQFTEALKERQNIKVSLDTTLQEIRGCGRVETVTTQNVRSGAVAEIECSGVFPYVGLEANTACVPPEVKRDARGFVVTDDRLRTAMPNLLAIGAVRSSFEGTIDDAFTDAERAVAIHGRAIAPVAATGK